MLLAEYSKETDSRVQQLIVQLVRLLYPFRNRALTGNEFDALIDTIYPSVNQTRTEVSRFARQYFDAQRVAHIGRADHPVDLDGYSQNSFRAITHPLKRKFALVDVIHDQSITDLANIAATDVRKGGSRTILRAVQTDPRCEGWARVDNAPPTCGFCLMLISRGPDYTTRNPDFDAHKGCTCTAVPVYDRSEWDGRDQFLEAEELYKSVTSGLSGKDAIHALNSYARDQKSLLGGIPLQRAA